MVKINFPRIDLDTHAELIAWRSKANHASGDWTSLKEFLAEQTRLQAGVHQIPKCWYTEMPQGDDFALDVEHFRPKNAAEPLNKTHIKAVETLTGSKFYQNPSSTAYPWLEFNYRNYRLTSALPNRGGGKHIYFPVAYNSTRLSAVQEPWGITEFNLLLDPADDHDASLLMVLPNGQIVPKAPKTPMTMADYQNFQANWQADGFNFLRATISIILYRLDYPRLIRARKEVFDAMTQDIKDLLALMKIADEELRDRYIAKIFRMILPSAPFSLAARSALNAYMPAASADGSDQRNFKILKDALINGLNKEMASRIVDWNRP